MRFVLGWIGAFAGITVVHFLASLLITTPDALVSQQYAVQMAANFALALMGAVVLAFDERAGWSTDDYALSAGTTIAGCMFAVIVLMRLFASQFLSAAFVLDTLIYGFFAGALGGVGTNRW